VSQKGPNLAYVEGIVPLVLCVLCDSHANLQRES
jgi:hypothetical protein